MPGLKELINQAKLVGPFFEWIVFVLVHVYVCVYVFILLLLFSMWLKSSPYKLDLRPQLLSANEQTFFPFDIKSSLFFMLIYLF